MRTGLEADTTDETQKSGGSGIKLPRRIPDPRWCLFQELHMAREHKS